MKPAIAGQQNALSLPAGVQLNDRFMVPADRYTPDICPVRLANDVARVPCLREKRIPLLRVLSPFEYVLIRDTHAEEENERQLCIY